MSTQRFKTTLVRSDTRRDLEIPFDPNEVWGVKERHHITGTIDGHPFRGCLESRGARYFLSPGPSWNRELGAEGNVEVEVVIAPEGPQIGDLSPDVAAALNTDSEARAFFESLATFYRNGYIDWIESAKRPETRSKRIAEMMSLLKAGKKQR